MEEQKNEIKREVFYKITYGMYIVCSKKGELLNGQIANTVFQVSSDPPLMAVSVNKQNLTHAYIKESKVFTVSIVSEDMPMTLIGLFGFRCGRDINKFENVKYITGKTGAPIVVENCIGYLELNLINEMDAGTHTIFIGQIINADTVNDGEPMTYKFYHEIKKGKTQINAPTYLKQESAV